MNKEKQRIAIAEACGWNYIDSKTIYPRGIKDGVTLELPNYLNDLNAMHEAEEVLTPNQRIEYMEWLGMCSDDYGHKVWTYVHSTAAQRAEALLKALDLWKNA
jgi:hypothetical protein